MAVVTTFATTPLTSLLYPPWYQRKIEAWKRGEIDWDTGLPLDIFSSDVDHQKSQSAKVRSLLVYLRLDNMPTLLAFISLLGTKPAGIVPREHPTVEKSSPVEDSEVKPRGVEVHGLRLLELTERSSTVMKVSEVDEFSYFDPILNAFRILGQLLNIAVTGEVGSSGSASIVRIILTNAYR